MGRTQVLGLVLVLMTGMLGCSDEIPTTVGSEVVNPGYRTYEVVLDASAFLDADTTFDRLGSVHSAPFAFVANAFEGELDAHTLFRVLLPGTVSWQDTTGTTMADSVYNVVGGNLTLVVDSLVNATAPAVLELLEVTESWDAASFSWELRSDTADSPVPWQQPGGTTGATLAETSWNGGDTIVIALDSAAASVWTDSAAAFHGGLIRSTSPGTRLRIQSVSYDFLVRPESQDTVVETGSAQAAGFVVTPEASVPVDGELRVGGVPTWRTALRFRPLADVEIPCAVPEDCVSVPLSDVTVNLASLVLRPLAVGSRRVEKPYRVEGRAILRAPGVPLTRSALTSAFGQMGEDIDPDIFDGDHADAEIEVPVTTYVAQNIDPDSDNEQILWMALLTTNERVAPVFGYGAYGGIRSAVPPQLRLVITAPIEGGSP